MKRSSMLSVMMLCGALLFGCSNSVESNIENAKNNVYHITTQEEKELGEVNFYEVLKDFQDGSLFSTKLTGFSYEDRIIVLEDSDSHVYEVGDDAYDYFTEVKYSLVTDTESAKWEIYPYALNKLYLEYLKDVTVYVEMLDANGDIIARVTYLNGDASIERVGK